MTLRQTIQLLRANAEVADDEHQVKVRIGEFSDVSDRLSPMLTQLPALNIGLHEISTLDNEFHSAERGLDAAQVAESLRSLAAEISTMSIEQSLDLARERVRSAEKYVRQLKELVTATWQSYVRQPLPAINSGLVDALARAGVDVEDIRDALETAQIRLIAITSRPVPDHGDVQKYQEVIESIRHCGKRVGEVVDSDIAEGLVRSQEPSGVPLSWFTSERIEKLAELKILEQFRVTLR